MVDHFGANGRMLSICDGEFSGALADIGSDVLNYVSAPCIMGRIAKKSGTTHDDCTVVDNATGQTIPDCADTNQAGRCWRLVPSATNTCSGVTVSIQGSASGPQDTTVDCQLCAPGVSDADARLPLNEVAAPQPHCAGGQLCWRRRWPTARDSRAIVGPPVA